MADKKGKKRAQRATSNVFAMFEQSQVQEFKEAFNMFDQDRDGVISVDDLKEIYMSLGYVFAFGLMDQDRDGVISVDDLKEVYNSLGRMPKDAELKAMVEEAQGPINFTMLLTLFGDRLNGTDEETVIMNAFKLFDENGSGIINSQA
ncbi:myosin regulatory light polypeptide 9 [Brachionus plicatilis]|uniref:Myosin regulatory light polypeptide 9 n=1 Tax=Brachionus plicatilis TaxID=10195 RepID=A0A3M7RVJ6_BRAPC|nr:myosin regulatory light polypeptide 9 [Brachionus plicatilis]